MRLQVDQEFQQIRINDLNKQNNVQIFSTSIRGGKAFAAEQKFRELKTRTAKLMSQKLKITPKKITEMSTTNMNIKPSVKYGISLENIENKALNSERFKTLFNMHGIEKTNKLADRMDRYDKKRYLRKRKKLRENLNIGEKVYVLVERKKAHQENFISNQFRIFVILAKIPHIDEIKYYWIKSPLSDLPKRFQRSELFALKSNFI